MTTYTLTGFTTQDDSSREIVEVNPATLSVVVADANTGFSYEILGASLENTFLDIRMTGMPVYNFLVDGVPVPEDWDLLAGQIEWAGGKVSSMIMFNDGTGGSAFFQLGGDALPVISSLADFEAFKAMATGFTRITGDFADGKVIQFTDLFGVEVSQKDIIRGGAEADLFRGGAGRDKIFGVDGDDTLYGDAGRDKIYAGRGKDQVYGGNGDDNLFGAGGRDMIFGGKGGDYLDGGGGNDRLTGGKGNDYLYGDAGRDRFVFTGAKNQGNDTVADFQDGFDIIEIGGSVRYRGVSIVQDGVDTIISWRSTSVTLESTDADLITRDDFDFV